MQTRVLVALGSRLYRDGLGAALASWPGVEVIADTGDGREAVALATELRPNIAIVEPNLPTLNGIDATRRIVSECPGASVIAVSMHADSVLVARLMRAGASAYILADGGLSELRRAIEAVSDGRKYVSPAAGTAVLASLDRLSTDESDRLLTAREREVLQLLAEGKPTKRIADLLGVSAKTVETHRRQIMKRLGIYDVAGLTKFAIRHGLTSLND
jgi:DNA-binding NarL/FixJ family response regulator